VTLRASVARLSAIHCTLILCRSSRDTRRGSIARFIETSLNLLIFVSRERSKENCCEAGAWS
jgi:hypothetical protein